MNLHNYRADIMRGNISAALITGYIMRQTLLAVVGGVACGTCLYSGNGQCML